MIVHAIVMLSLSLSHAIYRAIIFVDSNSNRFIHAAGRVIGMQRPELVSVDPGFRL